MNRIRTLLIAATLVVAPSALAVSPAPLSAGADTCTMPCSSPGGDCCDMSCDLPCAGK